MYAIVFASGDFQTTTDPAPPIPDGATKVDVPADADLTALAWNGTALVDRSTIATWYVDAHGNKHGAQSDPSWQAVTCGWAAALALEDGRWSALPAPAAGRYATGAQLIAGLTDDQAKAFATQKARDQFRIVARGGDQIPEASPLLTRMAGKLGMSVASWLDAALA